MTASPTRPESPALIWVGCPACGAEPKIVTYTLDGAMVLCMQCGFYGRFCECFAEGANA